ncbi:SPOR domain-containing protein [Taklimakanibacter lacteus]|uniref:SPOR domain-containing protein n=1 Tax=Taklimakanibacter lacteus TaxID=2268456 RepID=UPI000E66E09B
MRVRSVLLACVCSALLAAPAAVGGTIATNENSSASLSAQARTALQAGDVQTAIAGYSQAIEARDLKPEQLANALINRGFAYQQAQEHDRAVDDYTAALRIDAMSAKLRATALYNRGLSQQKLKQPVLAIEDFTSALFLDPEFAHAYYLRGTILRENGQYLFALSDYEKALRFKHPQPHLAYYGEALAYEQLRRLPEAKDALAKAVAANPSYEPAKSKLAALGTVAAVADGNDPDAQLITASITSPEQIVRKDELPEAVKPPMQLVGDLPVQMVTAVPARPQKLFDDRIPPEDGQLTASVEPAANQESATDYTLQADAIPQPVEAQPAAARSKAKPAAEQIVAVEALPEPAADTESTAAQADQTAQSSDVQLTGWSVQLSSAKDEKLAWGTWEKLKSRHKALNEMKPVVVRADLGKKGVYYRLRLGGFDSQDDAKSACGKLKSRGLSCFVSRIDS